MLGSLGKLGGAALGVGAAGAKLVGNMATAGLGVTGARMAAGAAIGGFMGSDNGFSGFLGGAAFGAAGGYAMSRWGRMGASRNLMQRGLAKAGRGLSKYAKYAWDPSVKGVVKATAGQKFGGALYGALTGPAVSTFANRHGHKVALGLGAGAAGMIGSTMFSSNGGY